jgi:hypothetical protein
VGHRDRLSHSVDARVTERFQRKSKNDLTLTMTMDDPKLYTRPLVSGSVFPVDSKPDILQHDLHTVVAAAVLERDGRSGRQSSWRCTVRPKVLMMVVFVAGFAAISGPLLAHHGGAAFDMSAPVVLKNATVTEFVWINPTRSSRRTTKTTGNVQHWTMELGGIVGAQLVGWTRTTIQPGDVVTLYVWQAKTRARLDASTRLISPTARPCVTARPEPTTEDEPTRACANKPDPIRQSFGRLPDKELQMTKDVLPVVRAAY